MVEVVRSATFDRWLTKLKDRRAAACVLVRITRLAAGNPGDVRPVGAGVSETRIDYGPGYRVCYLQDGQRLILLLCGGDKSTQSDDITTGTPHRRAVAQTRSRHMSTPVESFSPFDAADYLTSVDDVVAYLEAVVEAADDDPTLIAQALGAVARSRNVSELARRAGMSREGLYKALSADGNPSFATVLKLSKAIGLRVHFQSVA